MKQIGSSKFVLVRNIRALNLFDWPNNYHVDGLLLRVWSAADVFGVYHMVVPLNCTYLKPHVRRF